MRTASERMDAGLEYFGNIEAPFTFEAPVMITWRVELCADVTIGAHSYINGGMIYKRVRIGRFCSIAYGVTIGITSHPIAYASTHPFASENLDPDFNNPYAHYDGWRGYTEVGHDVWIGQDAIVLRPAKIGIGAVVAANAVVTKDVPPYAIVAGVPARIIGYRFEGNRDWIEALLKSEWWTCPFEFLRTLPANNVPTFAAKCAEYLKENGPHPYLMTTLEKDVARAS